MTSVALDRRVAYDRWHEQIGSDAAADPMAFPWYRAAYCRTGEDLSGEILELGCGRGEFAIWLANKVPTIRVTGVDFSLSAVMLAQTRIAGGSRAVRFVVGDVQCLPFPDSSFDWILSCECMEHLPRPQMMAVEMFRVLKRGGRFCLTTENYLNGMIFAWLQTWITGRPFDSGSGVQPRENFFLFPQVRRYLHRAGLVVEKTASTHYQWLLLPRVDPGRLCTREFKIA